MEGEGRVGVVRRVRKGPTGLRLRRGGERLRPRTGVRAGSSLLSPPLKLPLSPLCVRKRPLKLLVRGAEDGLEVVGELDVLSVEAQALSQLSSGTEGEETPVRA